MEEAVQKARVAETGEDLEELILPHRKKGGDELIPLVEACLSNGRPEIVEIAQEFVEDFVQWKNISTEHGTTIVKQLMEGPENLKDIQAQGQKSQEKIYDGFEEFCRAFHSKIENLPLGKQLGGSIMLQFMLKLYTDYSDYTAACLADLHHLTNWEKGTTAEKETLIGAVSEFYLERPLAWFGERSRKKFVMGDHFHLFPFFKSIRMSEEGVVMGKVLELQDWLEKSGEIVAEEGNLSHPFGINYVALYTSLLTRINGSKEEMEKAVGLVPGALRWVRAEKETLGSGAQMIQGAAGPAVLAILAPFPPGILPHFPAIVHTTIGAHSQLLISGIYTVCNSHPESVDLCAKHVEQLVKSLPNTEESFQMMTLMILHKVAEKYPEEFTFHLTLLEPCLEKSQTVVPTTQIFKSLSIQDPNLFKGRGGDYLTKMRKSNQTPQSYLHNAVEIFSNITRISEDEAERAVDLVEREILKVEKGKWERESVLNSWITVFRRAPAVIRKRRPIVEEVSRSPEVADTATRLLDLIDGRSLENVSEGVKSQSEELKNLEGRVGGVEGEVGEMEQRTVSNAPVWAKSVSSLLNPRGNKDWRIVGQRLGYSAKEIRAWATQHNPAFSLLSEFYTTHKTADGTHFLLSVLRDLNRMDAVKIIQEADNQAKDTVVDRPKTFKKAPAIFLSYQWGHQDDVKLLKQYLEKEGYTCWMDIGQMGGGDSLYEEIDRGIRGAKVVLLCLSEKYCSSANCIRETNLANGLGKKIIPLQMEKVPWPPPGSLGPILAEKLFIRFYQRDTEKTNDERYWPVPKFEELMGEIKSEIGPEKPAPPGQDVFLSYQWDHQTQVKLLKKQLTSEGFSCWMDIGEMGGGDSLYEAIDTGIRNCKVVLVCFNKKYPESENCTKEVFLAAGLGKPMIPLLLEDVPFPPKGRQRSVLAQYNPLTFYHSLSKSRGGRSPWPERSMDSLVRKIRQCGARSERRVKRTNSAPLRSPSANNRVHIALTCSPDKVYEMKRLSQEIAKLGYTSKVANYTETPVTTIQCEVVVAALSLRFTQSKLAGAELAKVPKAGMPILPLLLDKIRYPPNGPANPVLTQLEPVDCTQMPNRAEWKGSDELEEVLDRLEALVPHLRPIRPPRREKSSIPLAKDHVQRLGKSLPMHPLAREATEIRIQVRPPTPSTHGTHIPIAAGDRRRRRGKEESDSDSDVFSSDEEGEDSGEGTTDTERKTAKEMQNGYKLPQLNQRKKPLGNHPNHSYNRGGKPTYGKRGQENQPQTRRRRNSLPNTSRQTGRVHREPPSPRTPRKQTFFDSDGPKLPSVYRQRFVRY